MLEVLDPGLLTTVQDGGRPTATHLGVPIGGACDDWSLTVANSVVGNEVAAPALEMTLSGPTLRAVEDCLVGVGGADMGGHVAETARQVESGTAIVLRKGQTLAFATPAPGGGSRGYLALAGGIDVPRVLGSASTCLIGGFGGIAGRALRAGDVIRARQSAAGPILVRRWPARPVLLGHTLRVVRGPHLELLGGDLLDGLLAGAWEVSARGDRQGIRLEGGPLAIRPLPPLLSHGVVWGAVQLPADGRPIVLLADHQTVGGYPVLAVVIRADLPLLGQLGPGDAITFAEVSLVEARAALARQRQALAAAIAQAGRE